MKERLYYPELYLTPPKAPQDVSKFKASAIKPFLFLSFCLLITTVMCHGPALSKHHVTFHEAARVATVGRSTEPQRLAHHHPHPHALRTPMATPTAHHHHRRPAAAATAPAPPLLPRLLLGAAAGLLLAQSWRPRRTAPLSALPVEAVPQRGAVTPRFAAPRPDIVQPELPWPPGGLEPHMSAATLQHHYGQHHAAYVARLNALLALPQYSQWGGRALEDIVRTATGDLYNQAAQVWNHNFFWQCLRPNPQEADPRPTGALLAALERDFGSFERFQARFTEQCVGHFGSGWVWLALSSGRLEIVEGHDAKNLLKDSSREALLTCDVWEHAYYIDHANARGDYLKAFWRLVDWDFVAGNWARAEEKRASRTATLSSGEDAVVGGLCGAMTIVAGMPLLTYKFSTQAGRPLPATLGEWYRGVTVQALAAAPVTAVLMLTNGLAARVISGASPWAAEPKRPLTGVERIGAATAAGLLSAIFITPVDMLTLQQQKLQTTPAEVFRYVLAQRGVPGLYHGLAACSFREVVYSAGMFGMGPLVSEALIARARRPSLTFVCQLIGSILSGIVAALLTHPVDTVKTCIQTDLLMLKYKNVWQAIWHVGLTRGWGTLYQGYGARTCFMILSFLSSAVLRDAAERLKAYRRRRRRRRAVAVA